MMWLLRMWLAIFRFDVVVYVDVEVVGMLVFALFDGRPLTLLFDAVIDGSCSHARVDGGVVGVVDGMG